jgi:glutamine amidotransferase
VINSKKSVSILNLGINNIRSVRYALEKNCPNIEINVLDQNEAIGNTGIVVLPGLGAFGEGMNQIKSRGLDNYVFRAVESGAAIVGICLGLQLLGDSSEESPGVAGLGLINGVTKRLPSMQGEKVPNVGWNGGTVKNEGRRFPSLGSGNDFYFVHSYHFVPAQEEAKIFISNYGNLQITTGVKKSRIIAFQFHPEKSSKVGSRLISEIFEWGLSED